MMTEFDPTLLKATFDRLSAVRHMGRVVGVARGVVEVEGLGAHARIGDGLTVRRRSGRRLPARGRRAAR